MACWLVRDSPGYRQKHSTLLHCQDLVLHKNVCSKILDVFNLLSLAQTPESACN